MKDLAESLYDAYAASRFAGHKHGSKPFVELSAKKQNAWREVASYVKARANEPAKVDQYPRGPWSKEVPYARTERSSSDDSPRRSPVVTCEEAAT